MFTRKRAVRKRAYAREQIRRMRQNINSRKGIAAKSKLELRKHGNCGFSEFHSAFNPLLLAARMGHIVDDVPRDLSLGIKIVRKHTLE